MANESEIDWDLYDAIWDPLERSVTARKTCLRKILQKVRENQSINKSTVDAELLKVAEIATEIKEQHDLREIDRAEFNNDIRRLRLALQYLRNIADGFRPPTSERIFQILASDQHPESISDRVELYDSTAQLILLARPAGKQFWDLARTTIAAINSDLREAEGQMRTRLLQIKESVQWVAPSWVFKDKSHYGSHSRYAHRTTRIKSITSSGLPSLGKRS